MGTTNKLPQIQKEAFTKAREALGLSTKDVSVMSCFSVRQIEQIENGQATSFYGDQNKVTAAKKVALLLNLKEEDAFDFRGVVPVTKIDPENNSEAGESAADPSLEKNSKLSQVGETKKPDSRPEQITSTKSYEPISPLGNSQAGKKSIPQKKFMLLLGIVAAVIFSVVNLRPLFFPETPKEEVVLVEEVVQAPAPEEKIDATSQSQVQSQAPGGPSPSAVVATVPVAPAAPAASLDCPVPDASAIAYKSDAPKKAGDMVYLQSKIAQTICVIDATGKTQNKLLEPGVGISIYGKPPFKVLTGGLSQVDLFYQGARVRLANTSGKTVILEQAELSQPLTPTTSTDSQLPQLPQLR